MVHKVDQNHPGFPPGNLLLVVQGEVGGVAQAHLFPPIDWSGSVTNGTKYLRFLAAPFDLHNV